MSLRVSGKNMDIGDALRGKAQSHIDVVVKKYFDGGYDGHLTLEHEGPGYNAVCTIHLDTGATLQSEAYGGDAVSAYEILSDTIEKRLRRYNRKLRSHRLHRPLNAPEVVDPAQTYVLVAPDEHDEVEADYSPAVIAESTANLQRMSVGEAVMQLDLSQADLVMFRHAGHGSLNVVYRRADGNIGWIDPALRAS